MLKHFMQLMPSRPTRTKFNKRNRARERERFTSSTSCNNIKSNRQFHGRSQQCCRAKNKNKSINNINRNWRSKNSHASVWCLNFKGGEMERKHIFVHLYVYLVSISLRSHEIRRFRCNAIGR